MEYELARKTIPSLRSTRHCARCSTLLDTQRRNVGPLFCNWRTEEKGHVRNAERGITCWKALRWGKAYRWPTFIAVSANARPESLLSRVSPPLRNKQREKNEKQIEGTRRDKEGRAERRTGDEAADT